LGFARLPRLLQRGQAQRGQGVWKPQMYAEQLQVAYELLVASW